MLVALIVVLLAGGVLVEYGIPRSIISDYRHLNRAVLGLLFWVTVIFAMATLHVMSVTGLRIASLTVVGVALVTVIRHREVLGDAALSLEAWRARAVPLAALVVVLAALFILGVRPEVVWDGSTYHLTIPRLYLEHGGFRPIQFNVYSNWPLNEELLSALGMALYDYQLATLVQWMFTALTIWALIKACRVQGYPVAGPIAACLFLANDSVLDEAGLAYVDLGLAFFFLMALLYALHAERVPEERRRALILSGICCGLMAGVKLIGIFGVGCIGVIVLWQGVRPRGWISGAREAALYVGLPCLLVVAPWYAKATWYTGNPVYPFLYDVFRGPDWSSRLGEQLQAWQSSMGMGRTARDYLLLPIRLVLQGDDGYERFDGRIAWTWILCIPVIVAGCFRSLVVRRAAVVALLYFVCWAAASQQVRLFLPALPVLALATAISAESWIATVPWRALRVSATTLTALVASALLLSTALPTMAVARNWWYRFTLRDIAVVLNDAVPPVFRFVNANLPDNAKLLFLDINTGFFCEREFVADSFFEASQVNAFLLHNRRADQIQETLLAGGFTHILTGHDRWGIPYPPTLGEFLSGRARLIYTSPQFDRVYEIVRPP